MDYITNIKVTDTKVSDVTNDKASDVKVIDINVSKPASKSVALEDPFSSLPIHPAFRQAGFSEKDNPDICTMGHLWSELRNNYCTLDLHLSPASSKVGPTASLSLSLFSSPAFVSP